MNLIIILSVLLLSSCGSITHYVKVDPVNEKRFSHDQKITSGMTQQETLNMFGSPSVAKRVYHTPHHNVLWIYKDKLFCTGYYCTVSFKGGRVVGYTRFSMEFSDFLVSLD